MDTEIDKDFEDINKESKNKTYIVIAILYFFVIVLSVLLFLGIKNQNETVKNNIKENNNQENKVNTDSKIKDEDSKKSNEKIPNTDKNDIKNNTEKQDNNIRDNIKQLDKNKTDSDFENILNQI